MWVHVIQTSEYRSFEKLICEEGGKKEQDVQEKLLEFSKKCRYRKETAKDYMKRKQTVKKIQKSMSYKAYSAVIHVYFTLYTKSVTFARIVF